MSGYLYCLCGSAFMRAQSPNPKHVATTNLVESLAEWLIFCRGALKAKEDMALGLLDERTLLPLVAVDQATEYAQSAAWVTTPIK